MSTSPVLLATMLLLVAIDPVLAQSVPRPVGSSDAPVFLQILALVLGGLFLVGLGAAIFMDNPELVFLVGGAAVAWWLYHYQAHGIAYSLLGGFEAAFAAAFGADLCLMLRGRRPYSRKAALILVTLLAVGGALLFKFQ